MHEKKIEAIVLNSHGVGQYAYTDHMPHWGETLKVTNWHIAQDGGKGSNVSCALGRLGVSTAYVGKVGNDPWGDLGEKWMRDSGVDTTYLYRTDEVATGTGLILIGPNGENAIIDGDSSSVKLTQDEVNHAIDAMPETRMLITGFEIPEQIALKSAEYAKRKGMMTALNPSPLPDQPMGKIEFVDYLFINKLEGLFLLGLPQNTKIAEEEVATMLQEKYRCRNVLMTLGSEGNCVLDDSGEFWMNKGISVKNIVNTAGAGDGFMAAVIRGADLREASEWAGKYATLCITIDGTIPSYRPLAEVEAFIASLS